MISFLVEKTGPCVFGEVRAFFKFPPYSRNLILPPGHADGDCIQTITHPAISVWAVSSLPNGDIVSGCSDRVVRVFSVAEERWLPEADLKLYDEQVANQTLPSQQIGDVKKSDLPGLEALNVPGKWLMVLWASALVADEDNRPETWRDKDGQERGCCRGTSGGALGPPNHQTN